MLSKEVARLSGVTVRTLRHYHQIGILPEPPRRENGYRDYGVVDVARVLRIKRLASLGLSLEQIGAIFKEEGVGKAGASKEAAKILDDIDAELEAQIAQLEERRRMVSLIRRELDEGGSVLETPAPIRNLIARMVELGASERTVTMFLHEFLLLDESEKESALLSDTFDLYRLMDERGIMTDYVALINDLLSLSDNAEEDECAQLARRLTDVLAPVIAEYLGSGRAEDESEADPSEADLVLEQLIRSYDEETMSPLQTKLSQLTVKNLHDKVTSLMHDEPNTAFRP